MNKKNKGFTLIEILLVIVLISTLAAIVFVALNPAKRLRDARDARRTSDVNEMLTAIHESIIDSGGTLPTGLTTGMAETQIGSSATGCAIATGGCTVIATACVDLTTPLAAYLKTIPIDPKTGTAARTAYSVVVDSNGIVTLRGCGTEGSTNIVVSR